MGNMKEYLFRLIGIFLVLTMASAAMAQSQDWYVAPSITYYDDDGDRKLNDSLAGGQITFGRTLTEHLSAEAVFGYLDISGWRPPGLASLGQKHLELGADLLVFPNRNWTVAPYFLVGAGYLSVDVENPRGGIFDEIYSDADGASASFGVGFLWKLGESQFSIRGEYRSRFVFGSDDTATDTLTSIGLQYNFGKKSDTPAPPINTDTDGDGVLDMWDECPNTARGVEVTSRGCEIVNIDRDADGDRVLDRLDECPNTPAGVPVDPTGCPLDSDRDGVTTDRDRCPSTPPGAEVDVFGCSVDRDNDGDGVINLDDECPSTQPGARVDANGCEFTDVIRLPGVNFGAASDLLLPGTESQLESAAATLIRYPDLQVEVAGHTDSDGPGDANFGLSERRANTVRDQLIMFGVDEARLTAVGYGESQPIADNETVEGRAINRRVELRIVNR
jgi:OOP family OmpA-OmpF porin